MSWDPNYQPEICVIIYSFFQLELFYSLGWNKVLEATYMMINKSDNTWEQSMVKCRFYWRQIRMKTSNNFWYSTRFCWSWYTCARPTVPLSKAMLFQKAVKQPPNNLNQPLRELWGLTPNQRKNVLVHSIDELLKIKISASCL